MMQLMIDLVFIRNFTLATKENFSRFFVQINNLHFFQLKIYSHQLLAYLNVPGIPVRKPLQNRQIVEEQLDVFVLGVIC